MNKGCNNCSQQKYLSGETNECNKGNSKIIKQWWDENSARKINEGTINDPDCFVPHEINERLDQMIGITNEMLNKIDV